MSGVAPLVAGALLAGAELAFFVVGPADGRGRQIVWAVGAGLAGVLVSALVLLAATAHVARSLPMTIAGTTAAVAAVTLLSWASRS